MYWQRCSVTPWAINKVHTAFGPPISPSQPHQVFFKVSILKWHRDTDILIMLIKTCINILLRVVLFLTNILIQTSLHPSAWVLEMQGYVFKACLFYKQNSSFAMPNSCLSVFLCWRGYSTPPAPGSGREERALYPKKVEETLAYNVLIGVCVWFATDWTDNRHIYTAYGRNWFHFMLELSACIENKSLFMLFV